MRYFCNKDVDSISAMKKIMILVAALTLGGLTACGGGDTGTPNPSPTIPANSANVTATVAGKNITIAWTAASGATNYKVDRKMGTGAYSEITTVSETTYIDSNLVDGTYTYRIRSSNSAGVSNGTESLGVTISTTPVSAPSNPSSITATLGAGGIMVNWAAVSDATSYTIERQVGGGAFSQVTTTTGTSYLDATPNPGTYVYRVKAVNAAGLSSGITANPVTIATAPANESQKRAKEFIGTWAMTYKIISTFSDTLKFNTVLESTSEPGEYFAGGKDQYGNIYVAWYDFEYKSYVIGGGPTNLPTFYQFKSIASDGSVSGIVWFSLSTGYSDNYAMVGRRISTSIPVLSVSSLNNADVISAQKNYDSLKSHHQIR